MNKIMKRTAAQNLVTTALCVALGLILPFVTAHAFGVPGTILLPMHIPVLLCGLLCGRDYGAAAGLIIPVLSSLLTGMPPIFPMLPIMGLQLMAMGYFSGLLYQRMKRNIYLSLAAGIATGLVAYALMVQLLIMMGNPQLVSLSVVTAVVQGIPGIIIQLLLIPVLVRMVERARGQLPNKGDKSLEPAVEIIKSGADTCVVMKGDTIIFRGEGRGVSPLLKLYEGDPEKLQGAVVADKIIGKAAAMILVLAGAKMVYGELMSIAGRDYLEAHGIEARHGRCVDLITNRTNTGICPLERSVLDIDDPEEGLAAIKNTIAELMKVAG